MTAIVQLTAVLVYRPCDTRNMTAVSRIAALRALGRDADASKLIVAAVRRAKGSKRLAAAALGVNAATLYRQIAELDLWLTIDKLTESQGWRRRAGRARGPVTSALVLALCVFGVACEPVNSDAPNDTVYMGAAGSAPSSMGAAGSSAVDAGEAWVTVTNDAGVPPSKDDAGSTQPTAAGSGGSTAPTAGSSAAAGTGGAAGSTQPAAAGMAAPPPAGAPAPPPVHLTQCKLDVGGVVGCGDPNLTTRSDFRLDWAIDPTMPISQSNITGCTGPKDPATKSQCVAGARCTFQSETYYQEGTCI